MGVCSQVLLRWVYVAHAFVLYDLEPPTSASGGIVIDRLHFIVRQVQAMCCLLHAACGACVEYGTVPHAVRRNVNVAVPLRSSRREGPLFVLAFSCTRASEGRGESLPCVTMTNQSDTSSVRKLHISTGSRKSIQVRLPSTSIPLPQTDGRLARHLTYLTSALDSFHAAH